jgi:hypothetical protein
MEIVKWGKEANFDQPGMLIRVSRDEAIMIIESLASQLRKKDPNSGRMEFFDIEGDYFSIAVHEEI